MKSLFLLMMIAAFSWSNTLVANSHEEDLKSDLKKLVNATEEFDFEQNALKEDYIIIDQDLARSWAAEQFGSIEAFTELLVRIKTNLDLLARDKDKPNNSAEDYKALILSIKDIAPVDTSEDAEPFKCYNAYVKDYWMCTAYGVVGEYGGSGSDCGIYLAYVAQAKRNFHNCIEENYGN